MSNKSGTSSQIIGLPQGGGALHGIGEKFSPDLHTGTGNFTVPIAIPAGRNGFQPQLNLVYSTGNGNGPFGLGWSLSVPGVMRKTSDGVPRYDDSSRHASCCPVRRIWFRSTANRQRHATGRAPKACSPASPITTMPANNYWEVESKDGLTSFYGTPAKRRSRPADLADPTDA